MPQFWYAPVGYSECAVLPTRPNSNTWPRDYVAWIVLYTHQNPPCRARRFSLPVALIPGALCWPRAGI